MNFNIGRVLGVVPCVSDSWNMLHLVSYINLFHWQICLWGEQRSRSLARALVLMTGVLGDLCHTGKHEY